jgi:3-oxoacyl-[acyl-carrier-protein] synthase II
VDLVTASGYGIPHQDRAEAAGIREVLGPRAADVPVMSIKGGLGNNGAGSGAIEFIGAVMAVHSGRIPPAINSQPPDPECALKLVTGGPVDAKIEYVLSTGFALTGGQCAALVIKRWHE